MIVSMRNPQTGAIKNIKVGSSWILFLFSWFFGLPLFLRKLNKLGTVFLILLILGILVGGIGEGINNSFLVFIGQIAPIISISLSIYLAFKGNELTAKNYLRLGWEFVDADSKEVQAAKTMWKIQD